MNLRNLEQRINKLEQVSGAAREPLVVILKWSSGTLKGYGTGSKHIMRRRGESERDLLDRAVRETPLQYPPANGRILLYEQREP